MTTTTADVEEYATRVRAALGDLPDADRDDLLADLADHLAEVAGEDPDRRLADLLGPPADYAAELRSSAGLAPPRPAGRARPGFGGLDPAVAAVRDFLPELRPGWWVLRALIVTYLLVLILAGGLLLGLVLAVVLVPASVAFGRWVAADRGRRWLGITGDVLAALALLVVLTTVGTVSGYSSGYDVAPTVTGPEHDLDGVTNLYPYDRDGRPLTGVQLFDQDGNPVQLQADLDPEGNLISRVPRYTTDGRVVGNLYPQEQTVTVYPTDGPTAGSPTVRQVPAPSVSPPALAPR